MIKNFVIYYSSRNNYSMLENEVLKSIDFENFDVINVDDFSDEAEKKLGKDICNRNNIPFLENTKRGLQHSAKTVIDFVDDKYDYVLWMTHDVKPITDKFFNKLNNIIEKNKNTFDNKFGLIGFNMTNPGASSEYKEDRCGLMGRAILSTLPNNGGWYRESVLNMPWEQWKTPFSVECPADLAILINAKQFRKHVTPSDKYHLFVAFDDIALQFLQNNIYNIVIPELHLRHENNIKLKYSISNRSAATARDSKIDSRNFGSYGPHLTYWEEKWGFDRENKNTIESVKDRYKNTLIYDFYMHRPGNPLKSFDLKK